MNINDKPIQKNKYITSQGSSSKLKALIKKNILVLKRNKATTLCEIFFPIGLMLILLILRKVFTIDKYDFDVEEQNTENFIRRRSVANVDLLHPDINSTDNITFSWNGMTILPALYICSSSNKNRMQRPKIATIGIPNLIKQKIIYESIMDQNYYNLTVNNDTFMDFDSIDEMEKYIEDE